MFYGATDVSKFETVAEKLEAAGLVFTVEKRAAYCENNEGQLVKVSNQYNIVRTDKDMVISAKTVSSDYKVLQNSEAFAWLDSLDTISSVDITHAGAFANGALVYMMVKQAKTETLKDGSVLSFYVHLTNGHIGNKSLVAVPRVVCTRDGKEILMGTGSTKSKIERGVRHTKKMTVTLEEGRAAFVAFDKLTNQFISNAKKLAEVSCTLDQAKMMFSQIMSLPEIGVGEESKKASSVTNRLEKFTQLFEAAGGKTVWNAYHATCAFITNERSTRLQEGEDSAESKRLQSTLYGANSKTLNLALLHSIQFAS